MSSQDWSVGSDPQLKSLNDQIMAIFNRKYWLWAAIWGAVVIFASIALVIFLPRGAYNPENSILVAAFALPFFGGFSSSTYFFSRFAFSRESRYLFLAIAFVTLGIFITLKSATNLYTNLSPIYNWSEIGRAHV